MIGKLAIWAASAAACPALAAAGTIVTQTYETPAAVSDQETLCAPANGAYPSQWTWDSAGMKSAPRGAVPGDNLAPRIEQHRQVGGTDTIVAVWSSLSSNPNTCQEIFRNGAAPPYTPAELQQMANTGCGPFGNTSHVDLFRLYQPGDTFLVYPAVYTGTNNNIVVQPEFDYYTGGTEPTYTPTNVTIQGVTVNGIRPVLYRNDAGAGDYATSQGAVYINQSLGLTIDNLDVILGAQGYVLTALVYDNGGGTSQYDANGAQTSSLQFGTTTLSHMRVEGGEQEEAASGGANGIFGTPNNGGTLQMIGDELAYNGGSGVGNSSGPGHNAYIASSAVDPNFSVQLIGSWSHDAYYGHDFKSRAWSNLVVGNYFQGGLPQPGYSQAEAYNVDIPNGGQIVMRNNVLVKDASGPNSNGIGFAYAEEGVSDSRPLSIQLRFNTFVAFAQTFDGQHPIAPMNFYYPAISPGQGGFPVANTVIANNAYVGYCPTGNTADDYRGSPGLIAGFADINQGFSTQARWLSADQTILGTRSYLHTTAIRHRLDTALGAQD
jgi:hypothetical protein